MDKPNYTINDLAQRWRLHEVTLRKLLEHGKLPGFKLGHQWRIPAAVVEAVETNALPIN